MESLQPLNIFLCVLFLSACTNAKPALTREKRADDLQPLQTVVEQQGALIQTLQSKVAALETKQQQLSAAGQFPIIFPSQCLGQIKKCVIRVHSKKKIE
jgi:hypothetical protein